MPLFASDPLIEYPSVLSIGPRPGTIFLAPDYMTRLGLEIARKSEIDDQKAPASLTPIWMTTTVGFRVWTSFSTRLRRSVTLCPPVATASTSTPSAFSASRTRET